MSSSNTNNNNNLSITTTITPTQSIRHIITFRGDKDTEEEEDVYRNALLEKLSPTINIIQREPVLDFSYQLEPIYDIFKTSTIKISVIIITSIRAVLALEYASKLNDNVRSFLKQCQDTSNQVKWFVPGPATKTCLEQKLGISTKSIVGDDSGSADGLMTRYLKYLSPNNNNSQQILYCCGNSRRPTIANGLNELNIPFTEIIVYETIPRVISDEEAEHLLNLKNIEQYHDIDTLLCFFSPSGIQESIIKLAQSNVSSRRLFAWIAIGETTAHHLRNAITSFNTVHNDEILLFVAPTPNPAGIVIACQQAIRAIDMLRTNNNDVVEKIS
jgi:uroporphyrinogen-III synthase